MAQLRSPLKNVDGISYTIITKDDFEELDALGEVYIRDEVISGSIGITARSCEDLLREMKIFAEHGNMSIVARDPTANNKVVGSCYADVLVKDGPIAELPAGYTGPEKELLTKMDVVIDQIRDQIDLYDYFGEDRFMRVFRVTVLPEYRGRGILKNMARSILEMTRSRGIRCCTVECSAEPSFRAFSSVGFKKVRELLFTDIKMDGEVICKNTGEHKSMRLLVQKLD